jgi:hypothetical protein
MIIWHLTDWTQSLSAMNQPCLRRLSFVSGNHRDDDRSFLQTMTYSEQTGPWQMIARNPIAPADLVHPKIDQQNRRT